jgi:type IV secretory pathway VirB10-like protein
MPDGYSVDLDQFHGLDQIGEEGLKDKVNNHYLQIFGASIALGVPGSVVRTGAVSRVAGINGQHKTPPAKQSLDCSAEIIVQTLYIQIEMFRKSIKVNHFISGGGGGS